MNEKIIREVNKLIKKDGLYDTHIKGIKLYKSTNHENTPYIYDDWISFVLQNKKIVKLNEKVFEYNSNNYMVSSSTLPCQCETFASEEKPFIAIIFSLDSKIMHEIIELLPEKEEETIKECQRVAFLDIVTPKIEDLVYRLVTILNSEEESKILGPSILKELYYRVAKGEHSAVLYRLFKQSSNEAKIARALKKIHTNYADELCIPNMARIEEMSTSSFHNHFKKITEHTPFQYIKKIRLSKAKDLISKENLNVNEVAQKVGYDSIPQFSREFKKYFGYPPKEAKISFEEYSIS
ncbi:AraC family transcriptional regulator [Poseidonibacter lekithochrous]|uniref:AraC family transcriptional regulator n=1 Tax=Poseidonibacter lekithochrous TaxID=1904463 RepID=UPI000D336FEC|nr:AraC family transcriptional regulator [Poseidonibacter lekithochrous]